MGNNVSIGDSGYEVLPYLMVPLPRPVSPEEQLYNESLIRTSSTVERLFGVWKRRFSILSTGIRIGRENIQKTDAIIVACAVLQNIACKHKEQVLPVDPDLPVPPDEQFLDDNVRLNVMGNARDAVRSAIIDGWFAGLL
ncbi:hypothetical protein JTB14_026985 [Gonioctena quinquepunctata]|nr:hypothetical protein JTB14_026985 [Gonioctena quinquepunctata]